MRVTSRDTNASNFLEQSINDLRGSIVRIYQNSKTRRTEFRRHDEFPEIDGNLSRNSGGSRPCWAGTNPDWRGRHLATGPTCSC
jgi:hypothetical protein